MLHPRIRALLIAQRAAGLPAVETLPVATAREDMRLGVPTVSGPPIEGVRLVDTAFPGPAGPVPVRIYTPGGEAPFPGVVYFHGGGFVIGDLDTHDPVCRRLALASGAVVVAVDYRLAPEHPFPAAVEDAVAATTWVADAAATLGIDARRLFVAGDSAGGTLAAVSALAARDARGPDLAGQVLIYPVTDHYSAGHASYRQYSTGYGLSRDTMVWFWDHYLPEGRAETQPRRDGEGLPHGLDRASSRGAALQLGKPGPDDPRASPLRAASLAGLPPALVITAEFDVLRDEGLRYVERLRQAGVEVTHTHAGTVHHGFLRMFAIVEEAQAAIDGIGGWVQARGGGLPRTAAR